MGFFRKIKNSIYSQEFYASIPQTKLRSAIGYFLLLTLCVAILGSIRPIYEFSTNARPAIDKLINQVKEIYPSELVLKIKDGQVTSNVQEPYFIALPEEFGDISNATDNLKLKTGEVPSDTQGAHLTISTEQTSDTSNKAVNLVVIDTVTPYSSQQFNQYKTFAWIAKDSIIVKDSEGIKVIDLSETKDITIDKAFIESIFAKISPWLKWITPIATAGILLAFYALYLVRLIYLFFLAFLIWILLKLIDKSTSYWNSYKIGLYALTLAFIVDMVLGFLKIQGFMFMTTIISLVVVWVNLRKSSQAAESQPDKATQPAEPPKPQPTQPLQTPQA